MKVVRTYRRWSARKKVLALFWAARWRSSNRSGRRELLGLGLVARLLLLPEGAPTLAEGLPDHGHAQVGRPRGLELSLQPGPVLVRKHHERGHPAGARGRPRGRGGAARDRLRGLGAGGLVGPRAPRGLLALPQGPPAGPQDLAHVPQARRPAGGRELRHRA